MNRSNKPRSSKEIRVWGMKRAEVDVHQLALAYYLLARRRIEQRRQAESAVDHADGSPDAVSPMEAA